MALTHDQFMGILAERSRLRWAEPPLDPTPTRAVMTIVHDEAFFLPIWLTYYSRFFAPDDIYVLDHDTTDGSTDRPGFHRLPVSHDGVDHRWMRDTVSALQRELQQTYDVVLFTDVDEIVAFDPDLGDLGQFIDRFRDPFVQCVGHEIIHRPDREPPFDPTRPVLEQRSWWFANAAYNKPLLATEPLDWVPGFHGVENAVERRLVDLDTNLHLFHLHRLDFERCRQRHALRRTRRWDADDLARGYAAHNLLDSGEEFERWFRQQNGVDTGAIQVRPIPSRWKHVF